MFGPAILRGRQPSYESFYGPEVYGSIVRCVMNVFLFILCIVCSRHRIDFIIA